MTSNDTPGRRVDEPGQPPAEPMPVEPTRTETSQAAGWEAEPTAPLTWDPPVEPDHRLRNPLSVSHLVAGLVFLGIAGIWLAQEMGAVETGDLDLLVPLLLVVVGATGLLAGLVRAMRSEGDRRQG